MSLTLILGPMKSGKSLELIARMSALEYSDQRPILIQPDKNVREDGIRSRLGVEINAVKTASLCDVDVQDYDVIGVDEVFMFPESESEVIRAWLAMGKTVLISSLDLTGSGKIPEMVTKLYQLGPDEVVSKYAVCESCRSTGAQFSQILKDDQVMQELPEVVPEDGTFEYRPVCRSCYFKV